MNIPTPATQWGTDPEFFGPRHAAREALLFEVLRSAIAPPAEVLDAGSGSGSFAGKLVSAGYGVVGVDQSERFVAYAGERILGARFQRGDVTRLELPDGTFDAVVAGEVLEHLEDDARAAAEFFRVLRPGGWCLVSVPADPRLWDASDDWAGHRRRYSDAALRRLFEAQGFEVRRLFRWGFPFTRLYHRQVYLRMLRRKRDGGIVTRPLAGWRKLASKVVGLVLKGDRLFDGAPWGIGWVLLAHKPGTGQTT
ncbi:MAG TPA: class I SAM-dependent methyltransferase [Oscillatoriaceae cyanobacterium]